MSYIEFIGMAEAYMPEAVCRQIWEVNYRHAGCRCRALITFTEGVSPSEMDARPDLQWIATPMTGVEHIATGGRRIEVIGIAGEGGLEKATATAEHTLGLILRSITHGISRHGPPRRELRDSVVAILGLGRIGKMVENLVLQFGAHVSLTAAGADIITIHLSGEAKPIELDEMWAWKPGAIVVNTARPHLINAVHLSQMLDNQRIRVYATDFPIPCFDGHPQVISTPHIGGWGKRSLAVACEIMWRKLLDRITNDE